MHLDLAKPVLAFIASGDSPATCLVKKVSGTQLPTVDIDYLARDVTAGRMRGQEQEGWSHFFRGSQAARGHGLLTRPILDSIVLMPPLAISEEQIGDMVAMLGMALRSSRPSLFNR